MADEPQPMDPNVWGPPMWDMLFTLCFNAPKTPETVADLQHLFVLLEKVLPCSHCRRSYTLYRKEVRPTSVIRASEPESAAIWLWTIHDMVNQKLGKICISYDKLQKRHSSTTFVTHDMLVLDVLTIVALSVKPSLRDKAIDFIQVVSRLLRATSPYFKLPSLVEALPMTPDDLIDALYNTHTSLRRLHEMPAVAREDFDNRFRNAHA